MTPVVPRRTKMLPERFEMIAIMEWIGLHPNVMPYVIHIPNEGKRSFYEGKMLKKMGLRKGVSDLFIAIPKARYHGLWIEHKARRSNGKFGTPTVEQLLFIEQMNHQGYYATVTQGIDDAINTLKWYLRL